MQEIEQLVVNNEDAAATWATQLAPHVYKAYHQGSAAQIPTLCHLLQTIEHPDKALHKELTEGFPMVGQLAPGVNWPTRSDERYLRPITWDDFRAKNEEYLRRKARETPHEEHGQSMLEEIRAEAAGPD